MSNDAKLHLEPLRKETEAGPDAPEAVVTLTAKAVEMVRQSMRRDGVEQHGLRIAVVSGGCSGLEYQLAFEPDPKSGDAVVEIDGVRIFVDPASQEHLRGITIDYVTGLHAAGFKFLNPNATRTCGCGTSFAT